MNSVKVLWLRHFYAIIHKCKINAMKFIKNGLPYKEELCMDYGININFFARSIGLKKSAELIAKAGFTKLDYTPNLLEDNFEHTVKDALKIFEDNGLKVHQTHAPFNRYGQYNECHKLCLDRCAEATAYMGAKFMVAHGDEFDFENMTFSPELALNYNHDLFFQYVEHGKKCGYKLAFETVFEDGSRGRRRYTSDAKELLDLITSFNSESVVCCWDSGHAHVSFNKNVPNVVREFGSLIQCTHIHDNTGYDSHQMPLTGDIDWEGVMTAFKDIGYQGVFSIEYAHGKMAEGLMTDFISLTYKAAEYLWSL